MDCIHIHTYTLEPLANIKKIQMLQWHPKQTTQEMRQGNRYKTTGMYKLK
jgi:hypothetical protein